MVLVTLSLRLQPRTALWRWGQVLSRTLADLRAAEWPTCIHGLDSNEVEAAGGVLSRYTTLLEISQCIQVIPYHLKVTLGIEDSKFALRSLFVLRRVPVKRNVVLQNGG